MSETHDTKCTQIHDSTNNYNELIEFLTDNNSFSEFKKELNSVDMSLDDVQCEASCVDHFSELLESGFFFFYKGNHAREITNVEWEELYNKAKASA